VATIQFSPLLQRVFVIGARQRELHRQTFSLLVEAAVGPGISLEISQVLQVQAVEVVSTQQLACQLQA
jgi:hypothetical protein